jgi:chromosome segregation ATPase
MEFRDFAAKETSALLSRLAGSRTEASLRLLREAFDDAARTLETEAADPQTEQEIQELVQRLNAAAGAAARAASQKVQKDMQALVDAVNDELKAQRDENERLRALAVGAKAEADTALEALRADLRKESERADTADRDLDAAIDAHAQVDAARLEAEAACRQQTQAREGAEQDLAEVRSALEQAIADASRTAQELDSALAEVADINGTLASARADADRAGEEARTTLDAARRALEAERDQTEQLANALAGAQAQGEMLRADVTDFEARLETLQANLARERERAEAADRDLDAAIEAHTAVDVSRLEAEADARHQAQARAALEQELAEVRQQLDVAFSQAGRVGMQLESSLAENRTLSADLAAAQAEVEAGARQREALDSQLEASRAHVQVLERNQNTHEESLKRLEIGLSDALQAEASAREMAAGVEVELAAARAELELLRTDVDRLSSIFDASSQSVDELSSMATIADLLASLVRQLSVEFTRVALFRVKGNRLEGEHQVGFDDTTDVTKLVLPLGVDSLITRAASSGIVEQIRGAELDDSSRAPFGGTPTLAVALPVSLHGETFAVVYADSDLQNRESAGCAASAAYARLMVRAAGVLLTRLSQELKTLNELRDYAVMLLQEAQEMHSADQQAGRSEEERRSRLRDTVDCARQLYAQRSELEGPGAATLLDDRILSTIQADPATDFSRDLAAIVGADLLADSRQTAAS